MERKTVSISMKWKDLFHGLMEETGDFLLTAKVTDIGSDYRYVGDRARTTINLDGGDKEIQENYMYKMYRCEHTPIRTRRFLVQFVNIPYSIAMHLVRHTQGVIPFVSTGRDDRIEITESTIRDRDNIPVRLDMECNAQALINISRKRLCTQAHVNTRKSWKLIKDLVMELDMPLGANMVADCVYRGQCFEYKPCGFDETEGFEKLRKAYNVNDFNSWKELTQTNEI